MQREAARICLAGFSKESARRKMRAHLAELSDDYRRLAAEELLGALKPILKGAKNVFLFAGSKHEVRTEAIDGFLKAQGTIRSFPGIEKGEMRVRVVPRTLGFSSLVPGEFGIPSPPQSWPECDPQKVDIVLVPGIAFSEKADRLGQGRGYYDRALPTFSNAKRIGIGFDEQWVFDLPTDVHDEKIQSFVSNKRRVLFDSP